MEDSPSSTTVDCEMEQKINISEAGCEKKVPKVWNLSPASLRLQQRYLDPQEKVPNPRKRSNPEKIR